MVTYITLMSIWVILGNTWHGVLLAQRKGSNRPKTISEHAVEGSKLLWTHRIVHSAPLLVFVPFIYAYLLQNAYYLAMAFLVSGVVFDCVETLTLNKKTAPLDSAFNIHHLTAGLMSLSYFAYSISISRIAGVSIWIYLPLLLACLLLVLFSSKGISKNKSLAMQMAYFILVSLVVLIANLKLIIS